jgi:hypothetical protein
MPKQTSQTVTPAATSTTSKKSTKQTKEEQAREEQARLQAKKVVEIVEESEEEEEEDDEEVEEVDEDDVEEVEAQTGDESEAEVVTKKKKAVKQEFTFESCSECMREMTDTIKQIESSFKTLKLLEKHLEKLMNKELKKKNKRHRNPDVQKEATGFTKPDVLPEKFKRFYLEHIKDNKDYEAFSSNFDLDEKHARTTLTKIIYAYIRNNNLYDSKTVRNEKDGSESSVLDKRSIKPNSVIKNLFDIESGDNSMITFKLFQTYMSRLYGKRSSDKTASQTV